MVKIIRKKNNIDFTKRFIELYDELDLYDSGKEFSAYIDENWIEYDITEDNIMDILRGLFTHPKDTK